MSRARLALLLTLACGGGEPGVTDSATSDATAASETGDTGDDATLPDGGREPGRVVKRAVGTAP